MSTENTGHTESTEDLQNTAEDAESTQNTENTAEDFIDPDTVDYDSDDDYASWAEYPDDAEGVDAGDEHSGEPAAENGQVLPHTMHIRLHDISEEPTSVQVAVGGTNSAIIIRPCASMADVKNIVMDLHASGVPDLEALRDVMRTSLFVVEQAVRDRQGASDSPEN